MLATMNHNLLVMLEIRMIKVIEAIRLFLAYALFKDFGFEDPEFPDRVYKVENALYGLHQPPRACDYAGASLDGKSITRGCQFLGRRLISWQCKKQIVVSNSTTKAEYVAASTAKDGIKVNTSNSNVNVVGHYLVLPVFNDEYDTPSHTKKVFANMRRKGKDFSRKASPLFETMLIQHPSEVGEDETIHEEKGDRVEWAATTAASLDTEQDIGTINRTQSTTIPNEPIPQGTGSGGSLRCQDTILGDRPNQTRFERLSKQSHEPPLSRVNTLGSEEDRMQIMELMKLCTKLSERVLALENNKSAQDLEITRLKKRVKRLEKKRSAPVTTVDVHASTVGVPVSTAGVSVSTAGVSVSTAEPSTLPTTTTLIEDEDLIIAQTLMKIRSVKSKEKSKENKVSTRLKRGVLIREASETTSRLIVSPQQQLDPKDKAKGIMQEPEKPVKLMEKRKKHFAKLRGEKIRRKPPTKAQKRNQMCTYLKNMANYKHSQLKNKSFKENHMLIENTMKWIDSFVPMDSEVVERSKSHVEGSKKRTRKELDEERVKRQKLKDDAEKAELKLCLEIVSKDDEAINVESLATKYPIVDWKTHILDEDKMYYQIIKTDGSTKYYKIFSAMLDDFDRQDALDLYRLVKERFETTCP
nr:putative ribonuclease H-like domain-containing protein [Tanacetum cinerariifolium]